MVKEYLLCIVLDLVDFVGLVFIFYIFICLLVGWFSVDENKWCVQPML